MDGDLFSTAKSNNLDDKQYSKDFFYSQPLSVRMRPKGLDDFFGQEHLVGKGKLLRRSIEANRIQSAIFFGPSGTGKTTLIRIISRLTAGYYDEINAVDSNSSQIRTIIENAKKRKFIAPDKKSVLFIDEIHRFNKAQQDILMPAVEVGDIVLLGATTHNPAFSINGALLSRSLIFELFPLENEIIVDILKNSINNKKNGFPSLKIEYQEEALLHIAKQSSGDARRALNSLEIGVLTTAPNSSGIVNFTKEVAVESVQKKIVAYDKDGDYHYDTISAFIKSMRGSDPDASIYWLSKMLVAGEDPMFIARRIVIFASEDIGNADPHAILVATNALKAFEVVGMPEGRIILAQAVTYMASAPKSNASYMALNNAMDIVNNERINEVPVHLRDSHTSTKVRNNKTLKYKYPHDFPNNFVLQDYGAPKKKLYIPTENGYEKIIKQRLNLLRKNEKGGEKYDSK